MPEGRISGRVSMRTEGRTGARAARVNHKGRTQQSAANAPGAAPTRSCRKQGRAAGPIRRASCANRTWRRTGSFAWHWPWPSRNHTVGNKCESDSICVADSFSVSWESLPPPPDVPVFSKIACIPRAVTVVYSCACDAIPHLSAVVARGLCPTAAGNSRGEGPTPSPLRAQQVIIRSPPALAEEIQCPCGSLQSAALSWPLQQRSPASSPPGQPRRCASRPRQASWSRAWRQSWHPAWRPWPRA